MASEEKPLTLKDMVKRSGATPRTIRFYEEVGLLQPVGRTPGGHRVYQPRELEKLRLISDLRLAGFSLEEIRNIFGIKASRCDARRASAEVSEILTHKIDELKRRLDVLVALKEDFSSCVNVFQSICSSCRHPPGQETCESCTDIDRGNLPRTFRWIWNVH